MSELHFPNLTIKGFRGIRELTIPQLGRVNLITGKNNTGKSSILEALNLFARNGARLDIRYTLEFREESITRYGEEDRPSYQEFLSRISYLFHGFPQCMEGFKPIIISTNDASGCEEFQLSIDKVSRDPLFGNRLVSSKSAGFEDAESELALGVTQNGKSRYHQLKHIIGNLSPAMEHQISWEDVHLMRCIFLRSYDTGITGELGRFWDAIALTELEQEVVDALRIIEPRISSISMIGANGYRGSRKAIVRADGVSVPVPLGSFGDGMTRLFKIALLLVRSSGGVLLIR